MADVDSLLIAGQIELLGGGTILQTGLGAGATIRLDQGYKMGAPVVDSEQVVSLLIDGERPFGSRSKNREMSIPVLIFAPGRIKLLQAREQLLQLVDQQAWELRYTPRGLQPIVFDCFRATLELDNTGIREELQDYCQVVLNFPALPYGRSTDLQTINITTDSPSQIAPVQLDGFEHPPGSGWFTTSSPRVEGLRSAYTWAAGLAGRNFAAKDLSQMTSIRVWSTMAGAGSTRGFHLSLADAAGNRYDLGTVTRRMRGGDAWDVINWTIALPAGSSFDLTAVTGYNLHVDGGVYLDDLKGMPPQSQIATSARGGMVRIPGVMGTARAPVNVAVSRPSAANFAQFVIFRAPQDAPELYTPMIPLDATIAPTGTEQTLPMVDGQTGGLRFNGSYIVFVAFTSFGGSGNRTVTVTLRQQFNDAGITSGVDHVGVQLQAVMNPTDGALQIIGKADLPLLDGAADNTAATWTAAVQSSVTTDRIGELLILDTRGETLYVNSARSCGTFWVDEPNTILNPFDMVGKTTGGTSRGQALSVMGESVLPSKPLSLDPGDNTWMMYCPQEGPQATITLAPRWRTVRLA